MYRFLLAPKWIGFHLLVIVAIVTMINLDMIGRLDSNALIVHGVGTSPRWDSLLDELNAGNRFTLLLVPVFPWGWRALFVIGVSLFFVLLLLLAWRIWRSADDRPARHMFAYSILYLFLLFALLLAERGLGWSA